MVAESTIVSTSASYQSVNIRSASVAEQATIRSHAAQDRVDLHQSDDPSATYSVERKGRASGQRPDAKEINLTRQEIRSQVQEQTVALIRTYMADSPELQDSLRDFFTANPKAAEDISNGEIPEYFNVENTGRRILDIYFSRYDGQDRQEFAARARGIIEQAYGDVSSLAGGLPDIVQKTRTYILDVLDRFAGGEDISDAISDEIGALESDIAIDVTVEINAEK